MNNLITLTLQTPHGPFVFTGAEVPEHLPFGGAQMLKRHQMIGGKRIVDSMGPSDKPLMWSGWFLYASAPSRARFLDSLRREGSVCTLTWDDFIYTVKIASFEADYQKPFKIPYSITLEVIRDETALIDSVPSITPVQSLANDMARMSDLADCHGDATLNALASTVSGALSALSSVTQPIANGLTPIDQTVSAAAACLGEITNALNTGVASVVAPLAQLQAHVTTLISSAENAVNSIVTVGGVIPGNPVAKNVGNVLTQVTNATQLPPLYEISSITNRMQANLALVNSPTSAKTVTTGGGNLYELAAQHYGDASQWTRIAAANNLTDPQLTGINTLVIP
ncbi:MAG: hypothetical protein B7X10_01115 [Burkholderiales bacterium 21-58-4]|nr:MAG: hypothetical protein B7X10_01115 [Burkholderiales bacterium 21-58-4]